MTGKELYALYERFNRELNNCRVEEWENMDDSDQNVWYAMAGELPSDAD